MPSDRCPNVGDVVAMALTVVRKISGTLRTPIVFCEGCDPPLVLRGRGHRFCSSACRADVSRAERAEQRQAA